MIAELVLFIIAAVLIFINERRSRLGLDNVIMGIMVLLLVPIYILFYWGFGFIMLTFLSQETALSYDMAAKVLSMSISLVLEISLVTMLVNRKKAQVKNKKSAEKDTTD